VASENEPSHTSKDPEPMEEHKTTRSGKRSLAGKAEKAGPATTEDPMGRAQGSQASHSESQKSAKEVHQNSEVAVDDS